MNDVRLSAGGCYQIVIQARPLAVYVEGYGRVSGFALLDAAAATALRTLLVDALADLGSRRSVVLNPGRVQKVRLGSFRRHGHVVVSYCWNGWAIELTAADARRIVSLVDEALPGQHGVTCDCGYVVEGLSEDRAERFAAQHSDDEHDARVTSIERSCACGSDAVSMTPTEVVVHDPAGCRIVQVAP